VPHRVHEARVAAVKALGLQEMQDESCEQRQQ
jgi:hypothetical protein